MAAPSAANAAKGAAVIKSSGLLLRLVLLLFWDLLPPLLPSTAGPATSLESDVQLLQTATPDFRQVVLRLLLS